MRINEKVLKYEEKLNIELRNLFSQYGYQQYKMNKFEEYDLYSQNKDFLISDNIITFTDTTGKLMALKPDVTLSIVRNYHHKNGLQKVYYNENVYRISKFSHIFKEIPQAGVECIGQIDDYNIVETLLLALKSLSIISDNNKLAISSLEILKEVIKRIGLDEKKNKEIIKCIDNKNIHEIDKVCDGGNENAILLLKKLIDLNYSPEAILSLLEKENIDSRLINQLKMILSILSENGFKKNVIIDFSIVSDLNYYNGIAFKGFVEGVANRVLTGGQYDNLMEKMNRKSKAIGFAIYLDLLERLSENDDAYDADILLLYNENDSIDKVYSFVEKLVQKGNSVMALKNVPDKLKFKQTMVYNEE